MFSFVAIIVVSANLNEYFSKQLINRKAKLNYGMKKLSKHSVKIYHKITYKYINVQVLNMTKVED